MSMGGIRRALACALSVGIIIAGPMSAVPAAASAVPQASVRAWAEGRVVLALFPSLPPTGWLDDAIEDPFTLTTQVQGLLDFVRVCGPSTGIGSMAVLQFRDDETAARNLPKLAALPGVRFAQRDYRIVTTGASDAAAQGASQGAPEDEPDFAKQWPLRNTGQLAGSPGLEKAGTAGQDIRAVGAWAQGARGQGQVIAVLDEGPGLAHPDLAPNAWINQGEIAGNDVDDDGNGWVDDVSGWNYVRNSPYPRSGFHGGQVAGIAAAAGGNGLGMSGVAPDARIMPVDFIGGDPGTLSGSHALGAFAYAIANGATVINNSWGFVAPVGLGSPSMRAAVECARNADIVISWSSGNLNVVPESWPAYYPADNVLVTSSFDNNGCPFIGAHQDPALVDVMAPGVDVWTTTGLDYDWFGGTSAAAPHVAGVAALVRSLYPELTAPQVATAIRVGSRRDFVEPFTRSLGFLSAEGALEAARTGAVLPATPGTAAEDSSVYRCHVVPNVDNVDRNAPNWLDLAPNLANQWVPGGWPSDVPRPSSFYPGIPRP